MTPTAIATTIGHVGIERHVVPTGLEGWPIGKAAEQWTCVNRCDEAEAVAPDFFVKGFHVCQMQRSNEECMYTMVR